MWWKSFEPCLKKGFFHEFWAAWLLASLLTIAHDQQYLDWLDILSLRVASAVLDLTPDQEEQQKEIASKDQLLVVAITDHLYEDEFEQASPLDRGRLARLLSGLLFEKAISAEDVSNGKCRRSPDKALPEVLLVDLDLSPIKPQAEWSTGERCLFDFLQALGEQTRVVLMTPIAVMTRKAIEVKAQWMRDLCANSLYEKKGVHFAYPILQTEQGYVLRYYHGLFNFAEVAAPNTHGIDKPLFLNQLPCRRVLRGDSGFLNAMLWASPSFKVLPIDGETSLINWKKFSAQIETLRPKTLDELFQYRAESNGRRAVFIGGDYGFADRYNTPLGPLHGVYIHAASFVSQQAEKDGEGSATLWNEIWSFCIGFVFGFICGLLFHCTWRRYSGYRQSNERAKAWFFGISHLSILLIGVPASLMLSGWLLAKYSFWIQPAPLIMGMFLDSQISHFISGQRDSQPAGLGTLPFENINIPVLRLIGWGTTLGVSAWLGIILFGGEK